MSVAADYADALSIWDVTGDLAVFAEAIGAMFAPAELYSEDSEEGPAWSLLWDVDRAPYEGLPWLAQVVGERLPVGIEDTDARNQIRTTPNQYRGTLESIVNKLKSSLTGSKLVWLRERFDGSQEDEDWLSVATYTHETPSEQVVLEALRTVVPADINVHYQLLGGATWGQLETPAKTWAELQAEYGPTWADVAGSSPGGLYE